jgi:Response regulator containing a CheY-like receiver domain and an HTH DNA-binding domain
MRVLIIDDDNLVAISLQTILQNQPDIEVIGLGNSGEEAITLYEKLQPDILLMDIRMGGQTGIAAATEILTTTPNANIIFLTTFSDDEYIIQALRIGAKGYILKQNFESIIPALQAVQAGQTVFGERIVDKIPSLLSRNNDEEKTRDFSEILTARELDILTSIAKGLNNKEIATTLFLSEGTVRNYISNMLIKLDLRDRTQLAIFYFNHLRV